MKIDVGGGHSLIVSNPPRKRVTRSDRWLDHAYEAQVFLQFDCASGEIVNGVEWKLIDGSQWIYFDTFFSGVAAELGWYAYQNTWYASYGHGICYGEWYNRVERPSCFAKISPGDLSAWLAAH